MNYLLTILCLVIFANHSFAQLKNSASVADNPVDSSAGWSFAADGYYYIFPEDKNTGTFVGYADYNNWHIEARYNYEDEKTGSFFGGYRFETGDKIILGATPLAGIVFGNTNGLSPGLELDITWKKFDFYAESEYLFDFSDKENNFFYTWSELAITPFESFRTGISVQKTKIYDTGLDIQRGAFAQYSFWKLTTGVYYFNPFSSDYFLIASLGIEF